MARHAIPKHGLSRFLLSRSRRSLSIRCCDSYSAPSARQEYSLFAAGAALRDSRRSVPEALLRRAAAEQRMRRLPLRGKEERHVELIGRLRGPFNLERREVLDGHHRQRLLTYPRKGRVNSSVAGHAVSTRACGIACRQFIGRLFVEDDVIAVEQRVFRSDPIRRGNKQREHKSCTHQRNPPGPMRDATPQRGNTKQDYQRYNWKHVASQHSASQSRQRHDVRQNHYREHKLHLTGMRGRSVPSRS